MIHFVKHKKTVIDKKNDFFEKQLDLISQLFEFNQEKTIDSEEENLQIEMELDAEATGEHPEKIVVGDGVPDVILTKDGKNRV